jgi:lysozyme
VIWTLRQGDNGQEVKRLQSRIGERADGAFGPSTTATIKTIQDTHGLTADGIAGPALYAAIGLPIPLLGFDTSHWNGDVDHASAKLGGLAFSWAKTDAKWGQSRKSAKAAGMPMGPYWFCDPSLDAAAQMSRFAASVGRLESGELVPMLDLEPFGNVTLPDGTKRPKTAAEWMRDCGHTPTSLAKWATYAAAAVAVDLGYRPLLYTNKSVMDLLRAGGFKPDAFTGLWPARYSGQVDDPDFDCAPFPGWAIWQFSADGIVPGVRGPCDMDVLAGGQPALDALTVRR